MKLKKHLKNGKTMILLTELLSNYDRAYRGTATAGAPIVTAINNSMIFLGASTRGSPVYTIKSNKLFKGAAASGQPLATLVGDLLFLGTQVSGMPLARLKKTFSLSGTNMSGSPLVTVPSGNIVTLMAATYHVLRG